MKGWEQTIAAAQAASGAAFQLLRAAREGDAIPVSEVMTQLCDAIVLVYEAAATDDHAGQVAAAATKYLSEYGEEDLSI